MDKKYMFLNSSLTGGGSERVMSIIASYLADMGHDTSMLLLREKEERRTPERGWIYCRFHRRRLE